jgi:hypothetical protein
VVLMSMGSLEGVVVVGSFGPGWFPHVCHCLSEKVMEGQREMSQRFVKYLPGSVKDRKLAKLNQAAEVSIVYVN